LKESLKIMPIHLNNNENESLQAIQLNINTMKINIRKVMTQ